MSWRGPFCALSSASPVLRAYSVTVKLTQHSWGEELHRTTSRKVPWYQRYDFPLGYATRKKFLRCGAIIRHSDYTPEHLFDKNASFKKVYFKRKNFQKTLRGQLNLSATKLEHKLRKVLIKVPIYCIYSCILSCSCKNAKRITSNPVG